MEEKKPQVVLDGVLNKMDAKQVANKITKYRGKRIIISPPSHLSKDGKTEWNRLIANLYITDKDLGSLEMACQAYSNYKSLNEAVLTEFITDENGKIKKKKRTVVEYCQGRTSQNQVELINMTKQLNDYQKILKQLNDNCALVGNEINEEEEKANEEQNQDLMSQLL